MNGRRITAIVALAVFGAFMVLACLFMHPFGTTPESAMDDYIINNCQNETGANNAVTSVVFDYRGFDTLGEATILFTAVAGIMTVFRRQLHE
ncbi:MAG: hypothetical protein CVT48_05485 [Thermoplasmata archaeon HGW-Thermoplasmata-1]|nr:MAG: hypothetical protein CVT48_05485 [Thermoplasmata archaeon HGW-Thermoplasmata-1]